MLFRRLTLDLGPGEAEEIALAAEMGHSLLVMDDADGLRVGRGLGLRVTGVALSDEGFWPSESLRRAVLDAVEE